MIGFIIAALYVLSGIIFSGSTPFAAIFLPAANFLFHWYFITTFIVLGLVLLIIMGIGSIGTFIAEGGWLSSWISFLIGFGGATTITLMMFLSLVLRRIFFIGSSYLLYNSVVVGTGGAEWNVVCLIIGLFGLIIPLRWNK